ncbi:hypothetical protein ACHAWF_008023 [Thalassiosira exigua]
MTSMATTKRRTALKGGGKAAKRRGSKAAPAASDDAAPKTTASGMPADASLGEKRRLAALISWEKRRSKAALAKKKEHKARISITVPADDDRGAAAVTPPGTPKAKAMSIGKSKRKAAKTESVPPLKKRRVNGKASISKASSTKNARTGSKARDQKLQQEPDAKEVRRQAAKLGWERQRAKQAALEVRRQAAKLGWERRRGSSSETDVSSVKDEPSSRGGKQQQQEQKQEPKQEQKQKLKQEQPEPLVEKETYTVSARRQAAILGWQRHRKNKAARRRGSATSVESSQAGSLPSKAKAPSASAPKPPPKKESKTFRQGTKRSRRLAAEDDPTSSVDYATDLRAMNDLVARLTVSRGWMEFRPSSRHGTGTATRGYIPSSLAAHIRSGALGRGAVLDHGVPGVHYALDWDGHGGLRDMIATFGEDYAPCLTEEMMDAGSRKRMEQWEMGEDLPWREVQEAEDRRMERERQDRERNAEAKMLEAEASEPVVAKEDGGMIDILLVAGILASLDRDADMDGDVPVSKECEQDLHQLSHETPEESNGKARSTDDSQLLESQYNGSIGEHSGVENPLSCLADVTITKSLEKEGIAKNVEDECKPSLSADKEVLIIQARQDFKQWNFGLC